MYNEPLVTNQKIIISYLINKIKLLMLNDKLIPYNSYNRDYYLM